jgi:carboxy-terminal domain RNA polymerase II polypeptide A small phosphatase
MQELHPEVDQALDYQCPICLQQLQAPVVLNCSHSFCWGCITMYCLGKLQDAVNSGPPDATDKGAAVAQDAANTADVAPAKMALLHQGWAPSAAGARSAIDGDTSSRFQCPVCRKLQTLDLDTLNVDENLHAFVSQLAERRSGEPSRSLTSSRTPSVTPSPPTGMAPLVTNVAAARGAVTDAAAPCVAAKAAAATAAAPTSSAVSLLLQPQSPRRRGKLTIVLDLDGTLIASFPPRRAPALPPSMHSHLVGQGSSLNPQGARHCDCS